MKKQNAINAIKFLNEVTVKGHQTREAMNDLIEDLLAIVNADEDKKPSKDDNGKADA